jgi:hypothetical protein
MKRAAAAAAAAAQGQACGLYQQHVIAVCYA